MDDGRPERRFARNVWIAWGTWVLSLVLPAVVFTGLPGASGFAIPGWQAAAICALNPGSTAGKNARFFLLLVFLLRVMSATNVVMVASPIVLVARRRAVQLAFRIAAFGCACVDALALVWYHDYLSIGYVVWLASFVMLGVTLSRDRPARRPF